MAGTIVGGLIGAGATFYAMNAQISAQVDAEERDQRRQAYTEYAAATVGYLQAQVDLISDLEGNCLVEAEYPNATISSCMVWDSASVSEPRLRWQSGWDQVRVYGSPEVLERARELSALVSVADPDILPYSVLTLPWATRDDGDLSEFRDATTAAQATFDDALERFLVEACRETSLEPSGCSAAFDE